MFKMRGLIWEKLSKSECTVQSYQSKILSVVETKLLNLISHVHGWIISVGYSWVEWCFLLTGRQINVSSWVAHWSFEHTQQNPLFQSLWEFLPTSDNEAMNAPVKENCHSMNTNAYTLKMRTEKWDDLVLFYWHLLCSQRGKRLMISLHF